MIVRPINFFSLLLLFVLISLAQLIFVRPPTARGAALPPILEFIVAPPCFTERNRGSDNCSRPKISGSAPRPLARGRDRLATFDTCRIILYYLIRACARRVHTCSFFFRTTDGRAVRGLFTLRALSSGAPRVHIGYT